jgi:ankyrin repeat protein
MMAGEKRAVVEWILETPPRGWFCNSQSILLSVAAQDEDQGPRVLESMLLRGANANEQAANGLTALHLASANSRLGSIKLLLSYGANPNAKTSKGVTPLMEVGNSEPRNRLAEVQVVNLLLAAGANPAARTDNGRSVSDLYRAKGLDYLVQALNAPVAVPPLRHAR